MVDLKAQYGRLAGRILLLALLCTLALFQLDPLAQSSIPSTWSEVTDDFENGNLDIWQQVGPGDLSLVPGAGHDGSTALSVVFGSNPSYLYQSDLTPVEEAYLTFWFNPNGINLPEEGIYWIPSKSIRIADIKGPQSWHLLVGLRLRKPEGQPYRAYLEWQAPGGARYDYDSGEFDLVNGWQKITVGFRTDEWIAVWLNDVEVRRINGVDHSESVAEIFEIGRCTTSTMTTSGSVRYDDVAFSVPFMSSLWVDAAIGNDSNNGLTASTAFRTIQTAADLAGPGTMVHIQPGVYRETVGQKRTAAKASRRCTPPKRPGHGHHPWLRTLSSLAWTQLSVQHHWPAPRRGPDQHLLRRSLAWDTGWPAPLSRRVGGGWGSRCPASPGPRARLAGCDRVEASRVLVGGRWWIGRGRLRSASDPDPNCDLSMALPDPTD